MFRLDPDLHHSAAKTDFFAASDWHTLDDRDADLGGTNPLPFAVRRSDGAQRLVLALGKDQRAYLLDQLDLGGIGGALVVERFPPIRSVPRPRRILRPAKATLRSRGAAGNVRLGSKAI